MLASLFTTVFFSFSVILAARSAKVLGGGIANLARTILAAALLAIWAHGFGAGLNGPALPWFFLSGIVGFGLGDMALFGALPRIGPRLAILLTQCLAAPVAALTEWAWLGTTLHARDLGCAAIILTGVIIALAPDRSLDVGRKAFWVGVMFGIGSALGQAFGAVLSRKANEVANLAHFQIDGGSAAYQRILGGLLLTGLAFICIKKWRTPPAEPDPRRWQRGAWLAVGNAFAGPALGVGCYQWALKTTPSGIVLPIIATAPLVTLILAHFIDGARTSRRAVIGGLIAVAGAVCLAVFQTRAAC